MLFECLSDNKLVPRFDECGVVIHSLCDSFDVSEVSR